MERKKPQLEKLLTEGFISELDPRVGIQPNVNAEGGEYVMTPDGSVLQVLGEKHKRGGVNLILPGMTSILSDTKNATIKKSDVKKLKEDYNLSNVKTTDTYADVMDKYARKIGLSKILTELEDSFSSLKKQIDNPKIDEATYKLNTSYITKQIDELSKQKQVKDQAMQGMFSEMFASQEKAKKGKPIDTEYVAEPNQVPEELLDQPEDATIQEAVSIEQNPDELTQPEIFELGGTVKTINDLSSKYGWTPRKTYDHLVGKGLIKKYQGGGTVPYTTFYNDNAYADNTRNKQSANTSAYGIVEANQAIQYLYSNFPTILQKPEYKGLVEFSENGQPSLKKGINLNKQNQLIGDLQKDMNNQMQTSAKVIAEDQTGRFSAQDKQRAQGYLQKETFTQDATVDKGIRTYDQKLGDFTSGRYSIGVNLVKPEELKKLKELGITTLKQLRPEVLQTLSPETQTRIQDFSTNLPPEADFSIAQYQLQAQVKLEEPVVSTQVDVQGNPIINDITGARTPAPRIPRGFFMPDDSIPPPSALSPESLATIDLQRIDPVRVGIEPQLQNIARERNFAAQQLASLPSSQRASTLANVVASSQQAESNAITQATQLNAQNFASAELFNIGQDTSEKQFNTQSRLNYEARALRGLSNTQQDINNYFMANRAINLNNYQEVMDMNRLDALYPDVSLDMFGVGSYYDPQYQFQLGNVNPYAERVLRQQ